MHIKNLKNKKKSDYAKVDNLLNRNPSDLCILVGFQFLWVLSKNIYFGTTFYVATYATKYKPMILP